MNKLATALLISVIATVLIGCSSGSSSSAPENISGRFEGSFRNTDDTQDGSAVFDLVQAENSDVVTGNALFGVDSRNICLISGPISGTVTGFTANLSVNGISFQLNISNSANTLSGTYVLSGTVAGCSGPTGSGEITLNKVSQ